MFNIEAVKDIMRLKSFNTSQHNNIIRIYLNEWNITMKIFLFRNLRNHFKF